MAKKRTTSPEVKAYLDALPADRRALVDPVRKAILANLDDDYEEGIQYRMIGYYVPHRVFPAGYHCDPKQPLPFAAIASQKANVSIHLMGLYIDGGDGETAADLERFQSAWRAAGKKLDMGAACVRVKKLEDVPLDVLGDTIRRLPAKLYIARYLAARDGQGTKQQKAAGAAVKSPAKKKTATTKAAARKKAPAKSASGASRGARRATR